MLSNNSAITGARWAITKKDFLKRFNEASSQAAKKEVLSLLFNIESPDNTEWQPLVLEQSYEESETLVLSYEIYNVIPMATLENLNQVFLGPPTERKMLLKGFHEYQYATLPKISLFLAKRDAFWIDQNYLVLQINKTQKQLEQYFSQIIRQGLEEQELFVQYLTNFIKQFNYNLKLGIAFRFLDQVDKMADPHYDLLGSFYTIDKDFEHEGQMHEALKKMVRDHAKFGAENALAIRIVN